MSFLKSLGPKDDLLASRVLCVWPELLARDVEGQLRPVVNYLMSLGLEVCVLTHNTQHCACACNVWMDRAASLSQATNNVPHDLAIAGAL